MTARPRADSSHATTRRRVGLALLLLVAFVLRVWNLNWDEGTHQHPDERFWSIVTSELDWVGPIDYFDSDDSTLNPYNVAPTFVYGTLPLLTTKAVADGLDNDVPVFGALGDATVWVLDTVGIDLRREIVDADGRTVTVDAFDDGYDVNLVGRLLSALIDTGTVLLAYLLGRELVGRRAGLVAAGFLAFTPLHIQYSHFHGAEPWVTFFVTAGVLLSLRLGRRAARYGGGHTERIGPVLAVAATTGVVFGLAAASKLIGVFALVVPAVALVLAALPPVVELARCHIDRRHFVAGALLLGLALAAVVASTTVAPGPVAGLGGTFFFLLFTISATLAFVRGTRIVDERDPLPPRLLYDQDADDPHRMIVDDGATRAVRRIAAAAVSGLVLLVATAVTFRIFQPYAFDGLVSTAQPFRDDLDYLASVNSGGGFPWVFQWIGRTPLWTPLGSVFWWGMGPALAVAVVLGIGRAAADVVRRRRWTMLLPLVFVAMMLGLVSQQFNPLIRYLLPGYPVAIVLAGHGVVGLWDSGRRRLVTGALSDRVAARGRQALAISLLAVTAFWGLAFVNGVYDNEHPRLEASRWMAENLPAGSVLSTQSWDDSLPLALPDTEGVDFTQIGLDPVEPDRSIDPSTQQNKVERFIDGLDQVDYVVEASNRLYGSIPRFPAKYPATTAYYTALFDGSLGFEQIRQFRSQPSLFGIDLPDADAEETFTVYDHPTVTIWQKTDQWSRERATAILNPARAAEAPDVEPKDAGTNALRLRPEAREQLATGPTFSETFTDDGPTGTLTWLWWLAWLQLAAFAVLPWSTVLFDRLPDKGYGLSKVVGFATVGLVAWSLVAWDIVDFGRTTAIASLTVVGVVGAVVWWLSRRRMSAIAGDNARTWLVTEAVFLVVFGIALALRAANPDLWEQFLGGEKPMELGYLTAISRTTDLPAYDPWFAGGFMNYYYVGWFLLAVPIRALRVLPEVGFQLGVATYAALAAATAFSVVHNLVAISRRRWAGVDDISPAPVRAGLLGVVLLLGIGNLDALRQHQDRLEAVNTWQTATDWPIVGPMVTFVGGTWAWVTGAELAPFDWWGPSRVQTPVEGQVADITEFPYFTFLFGDLHPHMMGLAFVGLTVALALALVQASQDGDRLRTGTLALALGVVTGLIRTVNTWDLPATVLIAGAAVLLGAVVAPGVDPDRDPDGEGDRRRTGWAALVATVGVAVGASTLGGPGGTTLLAIGAVGVAAMVALLSTPSIRQRIMTASGHLALVAAAHVAVFWPYLRNNETFDTGTGSAQYRSPTGDFLVHWGVFVFLALAMGAALLVDARRRARVDGHRWRWSLVAGVAAAIAGAGLIAGSEVSAAFGICVAGALTAMSFLARELRRDGPDSARIVVLGMVALGFAIAGGPDVIVVDNDISRMNTVFKFWLQAWQLFALAGAFAVWQVARVLGERLAERPLAFGGTSYLLTMPLRRGRVYVWGTLVSLLVLAGLAYPLLATSERLDVRFSDIPPTLDGLAYLDAEPVIVKDGPDRDQDGAPDPVTVALAQDLPLIDWLRDNVAGRPTIVEWSGALYDWNARFSVHTGLPTVIGWDWHQRQQRGPVFGATIDERRNAVQRFYSFPDPDFVTSFLQTYEVGYVLIGTQEHRHGTAEALATIATHPALREVFRDGDKAIFEVVTSALWPGMSPADLEELAAG